MRSPVTGAPLRRDAGELFVFSTHIFTQVLAMEMCFCVQIFSLKFF